MKARTVNGVDAEGPLRSNAALIVRTRLEELRDLADEALAPGAATAQHEMRIAAKRLRYVLEITEICFGADARRARDAAKELQGVLGDIHDCDVMEPRADGIESLIAHLHRRRDVLFKMFRDLWEAQETSGTWAALEGALD